MLFTHGTDTLVWSATAISFILGKSITPVVFTGSQLPLTTYRTDAVINIQDSISTLVEARRRSIIEVMAVADRTIIRGNRGTKVSESDFSYLDSPAYPFLGKSSAYGIEFNQRADIFTFHPDKQTYRQHLSTRLNRPVYEDFNRDIVPIQLTPLTTEPLLRRLLVRKERIPAVIFGSFGAGNTPERILPVIKDLTREGVVVVISPIRAGADTAITYENARKAVEEGGAIQARDMTTEAISVKLSWLLGQEKNQKLGRDEIEKLLLRSYYGEVTEERKGN